MSNEYQANRALQAQQPVAMAPITPQDRAAIDVMKQTDPELGKRMLEIILSQPANKKLSAARALAAAMYERENRGRKLGRDFYVDEKMGIVPSYRGEQKDAEDASDFYTQFRTLTPDEITTHEVLPVDVAVICEGYQFALMRRLQALNIPYRPTLGVGILRETEKFKTRKWNKGLDDWEELPRDKWLPIDPPVGKTWRWKAEQRAYKDCLRHMPGIKLPDEILEDLDAEGYDMPPETARLSPEQAQAWADTRRADAAHQAKREAMTPEERHAQLEHDIVGMFQPEGFAGFGDESEAHAPIVDVPTDAGDEFDDIPGAVDEQVEAARWLVERIMGTQRDGWDREATPKQIGALQGLLHKVAPDASDRQTLIDFMSHGHMGSAVEASMAFAGALIGEWTVVVGEGKEAKRTVTEQAKQEAAQIIAAARLAQGQTPLFVEHTEVDQ